jgi:hypothetical protein
VSLRSNERIWSRNRFVKGLAAVEKTKSGIPGSSANSQERGRIQTSKHMTSLNQSHRLNLIPAHIVAETLQDISSSSSFRASFPSRRRVGKRLIQTPLALPRRPLGNGDLDEDIVGRGTGRPHRPCHGILRTENEISWSVSLGRI